MAGATSQQQQATVPMDTTEVDSDEYKAFVALRDVLAKQLEHCSTSAANYAFGAELITDESYEKVFARDMDTKSNAARVSYLIDCVRKKIQTASSRDDASAKMNLFLDCLRNDGVFDELVRSLEDKVAKYKKDPKIKQPEVKALKNPDIAILAGGAVHGLATSTYAKGLLGDDEHQFIISGGNEKKWFITSLLGSIAGAIQEDPDLFETFITEVLDKIGPPVSNLGDRLRDQKGGMTC